MWYGLATVCVNSKNELLMVKQGKPEEPKVWALPAGGLEAGETYEQCCVRGVWEGPGYQVEIQNKLFTKRGTTYGIDVHVEYFAVTLLGGEAKIQDPDRLIQGIAWKTLEELSFPEDRDFLIDTLSACESGSARL